MFELNDVNQTRQQLTDYIRTTKRKQAAISKELGLSTGTLSQFLSGSYTGSNEDIARKVEQFLELERQRQHQTPPPSFTRELQNTKLIYNDLNYLRVTNRISFIVGAAGSGKTTALKHYAAENNGVIYVQADVTKSSPRAALNLIAKAMGLKKRGTSSEMLDILIDELTDTNRLIIIDEAQHLTERSFNTLRALNDSAKIGLVYAGTPDIFSRMYGRHEAEYDTIHSRIGYIRKLKNRYTEEDIQHLFGDFNLDKTIIKHLYNISSRKGGLRIAINVFRLAGDIAKTSGETLSIQHLEYAAKYVGSGESLS